MMAWRNQAFDNHPIVESTEMNEIKDGEKKYLWVKVPDPCTPPHPALPACVRSQGRLDLQGSQFRPPTPPSELEPLPVEPMLLLDAP